MRKKWVFKLVNWTNQFARMNPTNLFARKNKHEEK